MIAAGLVAKKAVERGLKVNPAVKTSLAPGSRVVSDYFDKTGLQPYLDALGFQIVGFGCTTCIGNSGPLNPVIDEAITKSDLVAASVLSGNRNFEARVHPSIKANFLMSPPLVVAFALAGRVDIDLDREPLGTDKDGQPVYLKEIWPTSEEVKALAVRPSCPRSSRRTTPTSPRRIPRGTTSPARPARPTRGTRRAPTSRSRPSSRNFRWSPATSARSSTRGRSASSATPSPPTTSRPPAASRRPRPPAPT